MGKVLGFEHQITWIPLCAVMLRTYSLLSSSEGITSSIIAAAFNIPLVILARLGGTQDTSPGH